MQPFKGYIGRSCPLQFGDPPGADLRQGSWSEALARGSRDITQGEAGFRALGFWTVGFGEISHAKGISDSAVQIGREALFPLSAPHILRNDHIPKHQCFRCGFLHYPFRFLLTEGGLIDDRANENCLRGNLEALKGVVSKVVRRTHRPTKLRPSTPTGTQAVQATLHMERKGQDGRE